MRTSAAPPFHLFTAVGCHIPTLRRSYFLVLGLDIPLGQTWFGMEGMSDHEKDAMGRLGPYGKSPLALCLALKRQHGIDVRSPSGMLVAICEMGSLASTKGKYNGLKGALAAVKAIEASAVAWKAADLARFGDKVTSEWTYHR